MKHAPYWFAGSLALALLAALGLAPDLAGRLAADAAGAAPSGTRWTLGTIALIGAFLCFTLLGAGVVALGWWFSTREPDDPVDSGARRRDKLQPIIAAVNRRSDLSSNEKRAFEASALALAEAEDAVSIRAAELVGQDDAVTAAMGLADEAGNGFSRLLEHASNIALPFSDRTSRALATRREDFARLDQLVADWNDCTALASRIAEHCKCPCAGEGDAGTACCCKPDMAHRARVDMVWD